MTNKRLSKNLIIVLVCTTMFGCIEPFEVETEDFESILVINATLTNEVKHQQVLLNRTFRVEDNGPLAEQRATVTVLDNANTTYVFEETSPGVYLSELEFGAVSGKEYQLSIKTVDDKSYVSDSMTLPQETSIGEVYPFRMLNDKGVEGVGILVDTFDPTGNSQYYRYEYEETYRIKAPFWRAKDMTTNFEFVDRPEGQRICYNSKTSNSIIITNTNIFEEDRLTGFLLNFIDPKDISIADRYSILVKQYVQSREANGFYKILNSFSESENLFSQIQPGFINGNILPENGSDERVLGFFDVTSISEKRIFFNREDIVNDLPKFSLFCERIAPTQLPIETMEEFDVRLARLIRSGGVKFLEEQKPTNGEGTFVFVPTPCGDCRTAGKSTVPDFWED